MKKLVIGILLAAATAASLPCFAAGAAFTYQGVIKEVGGVTPANKNRTIEFRLYDSPTGDHVLWGRTYNVLLDDNGLFNTALTDAAGSEINGVTSTGLASILAQNAGTTLYIGLTVDNSSGEISPRQALLAVPYAIHASDAASASGAFTVEGKTTLKGGLDVSAGSVTVGSLTATNLVVDGSVRVGTSGTFTGYGTIPVGGIIMWSGSASNVPDGWKLCDGSSGTPNLKGRFIVGYDPADSDYNSVGKTGGAKSVALSVAQMPSHSHTATIRVSGLSAKSNSDNDFFAPSWKSKNTEDSITTDSKGSGQAHENRPPYYAMCFIMRVK